MVVLKGHVSPELAGLALTYAAHISGVFQFTIRLMSDTETRFISVERIVNHTEVKSFPNSILFPFRLIIIISETRAGREQQTVDKRTPRLAFERKCKISKRQVVLR